MCSIGQLFIKEFELTHEDAITAYRAWYMIDNQLTSLYHGQHWNTITTANFPPCKHNSYGLYSFKNMEILEKQVRNAMVIPPHPNSVFFGKIIIWGKIIEHELGYRSEFAEIIHWQNYQTPTPPTLFQKIKRFLNV